jgi:hypothetical protein
VQYRRVFGPRAGSSHSVNNKIGGCNAQALPHASGRNAQADADRHGGGARVAGIGLGGFGEANEETGQMPFYGASNGETLSKTPQKVPGGLLELVKCNEITGNGLIEKGLRATREAIFENKVTGVNATTELAAPASSIYLNEFALEEELPYGPYPPALVLPVKIHLENTLLGSSCYIGSSSEPIELALTSGTTSPPAPNTAVQKLA